MKKENMENREVSTMKDKMQVIFCTLILVLLLVMEVYSIIHLSSQILVVVLVTVALVADLFFLVSALIDLWQKSKEEDRSSYEEIYNAQKASYLVIRKSFEELSERLAQIEEAASVPTDEIINAQKAVAKVTINRNKENTDALMNSNDAMINQLFEFEEKLENVTKVMSDGQQAVIDRNKELEGQVQKLQMALDQIQKNIENMENRPPMYAMPMMGMPQMAMAPQQMPMMDYSQQAAQMPVTPTMEAQPQMEEVPSADDLDSLLESADDLMGAFAETEEVAPEEEISLEEPMLEEVPEEPVLEEFVEEPELTLEEPVVEEVPEEPVVEEAAQPAPSITLGVDDDPNKQLSPDDIAALFAQAEAAAAPAAEEPVVEEVPEEPVDEEAAQPAPSITLGVDDDPNKQLSPDDIAALFAQAEAAAAPAAEEPVAEPEPVVEEAAQAEPQIDISNIDMSDPNRVMSPEEIQALFANL